MRGWRASVDARTSDLRRGHANLLCFFPTFAYTAPEGAVIVARNSQYINAHSSLPTFCDVVRGRRARPIPLARGGDALFAGQHAFREMPPTGAAHAAKNRVFRRLGTCAGDLPLGSSPPSLGSFAALGPFGRSSRARL